LTLVNPATWTRFQPIIEPAQRALFVDNKIGDIKRIESSFTKDFGDLPHDHRMLNPSLAGGGLFDLGPYAVLWPILLLFQHPKNERQPPTDVKASMIFDKRTGVDETTSWVMNFPLLGASATVTTSLSTPTPAYVSFRFSSRFPSTRGLLISSRTCLSLPFLPYSVHDAHLRSICAIVYGTLGTLSLNGPSPYPHSYTIQLNDAPENANTRSSAPETFDYPIAPHLGRGMGWQADAVARCLRDGKLEEGKMRWEETVLQQRIFDEVRRSGGLDWGQGVEGL
jgi:dihydrodiol dehydrogenase / D-xylose 1-dehydrogenase (NADP)